MADKELIKTQAYIDITNLRIAQEEGILTEYGKGMLEGLEGIVDFINTLETKDSIIIDAIAMPSDSTFWVNKEDLNQFEDGDKVTLQIIKQ